MNYKDVVFIVESGVREGESEGVDGRWGHLSYKG